MELKKILFLKKSYQSYEILISDNYTNQLIIEEETYTYEGTGVPFFS